MTAVKVADRVTPEDIKKAKKDYGGYIKVVVNITTGEMVIGGQWHADGEKILLESGRQQDIWGGGIDLKNNKIDLIALINLRPGFGNDSQEILRQHKFRS
ncbi:hypothetical protein KKD61_04500 [Patescibacteria group bacterium]|nr:hypothetical protein [Patescibacteria group bacterium]